MTSSIKYGTPKPYTPEFWAAATKLLFVSETGITFLALSREESELIRKAKDLKKQIEKVTNYLKTEQALYPSSLDANPFILHANNQKLAELTGQKKKLYKRITGKVRPQLQVIWEKIWTELRQIDAAQTTEFMQLLNMWVKHIPEKNRSFPPAKQQEESKTEESKTSS